MSSDLCYKNDVVRITDYSFNPNTFAGLVGKVRKNSPEGGREGRKKAHAARAPGPGLEPGTCPMLGEGPQLDGRGAV